MQMISAHWSEIENGYGLIKLLNRSNHYSGYYIKYNALSGSILFTSAAGAMRLWTTNNNIATITDYTNLMSTIWLFDIAATDTAEHEIDPTGVRLIIVMLNYNSFTAYGIYTTGMMSDTRTKVISVSPTKEYYCNARIVTSVTGGKLKIRLSGLDRHSNTVSANLSIYYAK